MVNQIFLDIYKKVWEELFPDAIQFSLDEFKTLFAKDILLPEKRQCAVKGTDIYIGKEYTYKRFISDEARKERMNADDFMEKHEDIASLHDLLPKIKSLAFFKGSRMQNSDIVEESDDIHSSSFIYQSEHIFNCQKIIFGYNIAQSEFMLASVGDKTCSFGIAIIDSASITNSFDIGWSAKSSNCYFCNNVFDLRDCMFCFNIASKQYCIANMQYTEEEYKKIKPIILKEYFSQIHSPDGFRFMSDF
jgi:hypothetical protein